MNVLKNITEDIVAASVDKIIAEEHACGCPRCRLDICAIALNHLQPKYVVTDEGSIYSLMDLYKNQNKVEVYTAILNGVRMVKENPRH